jgi:hypothetical protein
VAGCASWKEPTSSESALQPSRAGLNENKRRVVLEVEFVNTMLDSTDIDRSASLWQWVDETAIDSEVRRRLLANGIRVGRVANDQRFRQRLSDAATDPDVVEAFLSRASVASDISHGQKRVPMRLGRRYELPLRQPIDGSHVALVRLGDETIGRTLSHAQYVLAITATQAESPKQVQLRFRPEIQYGDSRQKTIRSDTATRIDTRRETWSIPELDLNVTANENDTLVLSATTPATGMAKHMLTGTGPDSLPQQLVLLVRVARVPSAADQL